MSLHPSRRESRFGFSRIPGDRDCHPKHNSTEVESTNRSGGTGPLTGVEKEPGNFGSHRPAEFV